MSPTCTNSHYDNHATFVPSINHNKDVALLSYVELYIYIKYLCTYDYVVCMYVIVVILDIRINRERLIVSKRHTYVTYFSRPGLILDASGGSINQIKCKAYIITDSRPMHILCCIMWPYAY